MRSWKDRPADVARAVSVVAIAVLILTVSWYGLVLLVQDARVDGTESTVTVLEREDDYVAWIRLTGPAWQHHAVSYSGEGPIDRILIVRQAQLDAFLSGGAVEVLAEFEPRSIGGHTLGTLDLQGIPSHCPPPSGGCTEESTPLLVFLKGDSWQGATSAEARSYAVQYQQDTAFGYDGPFGARVATTSESIYSTAAWALPLAAVAALSAVLGAVTWAVLEIRRPHADAPPLRVPPEVPTDVMLHLVRAGQLYIDGVRRSFLLAFWMIPAVTIVLLFVGLPTMQAVIAQQFRFVPRVGAPTFIAFTFVVPFLAMLAGLFLGVAYVRTRQEIRRWRELSAAFEEDARHILGA